MRRSFTCKPSASKPQKAVKAATTADMLDVFQDRLAELNVASKTDVSCSSGDPEMDSIMQQERQVEIRDEDYQEKYKDNEGCFGEPGAIYSLGEIKEFWNNENLGDPILADYPSYEAWWRDTRSYLSREV